MTESEKYYNKVLKAFIVALFTAFGLACLFAYMYKQDADTLRKIVQNDDLTLMSNMKYIDDCCICNKNCDKL